MGRLSSGSHDFEEPPRRFFDEEGIVRRVGIDLALRAPHRATVFDDAVQVGKPFKVRPTRVGIDELVRRATAGTDGPCEFIMEPTGLAFLPVAAELSRLGHTTFVPKPQKTHLVRKVLAPFAKTDAFDAKAQALVRHLDPDGVHPLRVPTAPETTLRLCVKQRARLVVDAARAKARIRSWLVLAHPHLGEALGDGPLGEAATAFLRRYLDPFVVRTKGLAWLRDFWKRQGGGADEKRVLAVWEACNATCELYAELRTAGRLPFDYGVVQTLIAQELERIEYLEEQVAALDALVQAAYRIVDAERVLEREVPGVGPTIAPTVEAFVGDVERFGNGKRFAAFFGLVPRTSQTGGRDGKPRQRLTKGGPALLKQYMFLAAETARRSDPALALAYERALARGKHHYAAVIAVAHKLVRRIYALLKLRAAARRALAEGRTPPTVAWQYVNPETGEVLTAALARAWVQEHCPSRAEKVRRNSGRKTAVEAAPQTSSMAQKASRAKTGSSEDAANEDRGTPPTQGVADSDACGKAVENPVAKPLNGQANNSLDVT
jgi:transposase